MSDDKQKLAEDLMTLYEWMIKKQGRVEISWHRCELSWWYSSEYFDTLEDAAEWVRTENERENE